jgi:hypothetical protein
VTAQVDFTGIEQVVGRGSVAAPPTEAGNDVHRDYRSKEEKQSEGNDNHSDRSWGPSTHVKGFFPDWIYAYS